MLSGGPCRTQCTITPGGKKSRGTFTRFSAHKTLSTRTKLTSLPMARSVHNQQPTCPHENKPAEIHRQRSTLNRRSIDYGKEHDQTSHGVQAAVRKFTLTLTHRCMIGGSRATLTPGLGAHLMSMFSKIEIPSVGLSLQRDLRLLGCRFEQIALKFIVDVRQLCVGHANGLSRVARDEPAAPSVSFPRQR